MSIRISVSFLLKKWLYSRLANARADIDGKGLRSLDDLIRPQQQRLRDREAERLGGL